MLPVDGGLARSDVLLQLLADLTGAEVRRAAEVETTALGAAQLAGLAVGALPDLAACRALAAPAARLLPRIGRSGARRGPGALAGAPGGGAERSRVGSYALPVLSAAHASRRFGSPGRSPARRGARSARLARGAAAGPAPRAPPSTQRR